MSQLLEVDGSVAQVGERLWHMMRSVTWSGVVGCGGIGSEPPRAEATAERTAVLASNARIPVSPNTVALYESVGLGSWSIDSSGGNGRSSSTRTSHGRLSVSYDQLFGLRLGRRRCYGRRKREGNHRITR